MSGCGMDIIEEVTWTIYWDEMQQRVEVTRAGCDLSSYFGAHGWDILHDYIPDDIKKSAKSLRQDEKTLGWGYVDLQKHIKRLDSQLECARGDLKVSEEMRERLREEVAAQNRVILKLGAAPKRRVWFIGMYNDFCNESSKHRDETWKHVNALDHIRGIRLMEGDRIIKNSWAGWSDEQKKDAKEYIHMLENCWRAGD